MSRTNAGETADFTFKFTPTTTVDNGCVEIYFPTDIIPPGASASNMVSNCDSNRSDDTLKNLKAMQDDYYKVSSVPLPITEGAYGPFHIITRNYYNGQIVDVSRNFASIYVGPAVVTEVASFNTENMIVSLVSGTDIAVKYGTALTFRFNVHVDLWEHDMFVIYTASNWSTPTAPACQSLDITNVTNHFTNADGTTKLDCVGDPANNRVIVYGLANDLDLSALEPTIGYF